jgi:hypothetical protein
MRKITDITPYDVLGDDVPSYVTRGYWHAKDMAIDLVDSLLESQDIEDDISNTTHNAAYRRLIDNVEEILKYEQKICDSGRSTF